MNRKTWWLLILVFIMVTPLLNNCGAGKLFEPTVTPARILNTSTFTPSPVPPTFTLTPIFTPTYTPTPPQPRTLTCTYRVSAFEHSTARQFVDTRLNMKKGETLIIKATGIACCDKNPTVCCSGPDGHPAFDDTDLVGRIGNGEMFHIGSNFQKEISGNDTGRLYLGYHDTDYENNSGFFDVTVTIENTLTGSCDP